MALVAVVKQALVQQREQRVQDGAVGLEDLVNKGHLGGGQVPVHLAHVQVVLKACGKKGRGVGGGVCVVGEWDAGWLDGL